MSFSCFQVNNKVREGEIFELCFVPDSLPSAESGYSTEADSEREIGENPI